MNRQDDCDVLPAQDGLQGVDNVLDAVAEIFATMAGHEDNPTIAVVPLDAVPAGRQSRDPLQPWPWPRISASTTVLPVT